MTLNMVWRCCSLCVVGMECLGYSLLGRRITQHICPPCTALTPQAWNRLNVLLAMTSQPDGTCDNTDTYSSDFSADIYLLECGWCSPISYSHCAILSFVFAPRAVPIRWLKLKSWSLPCCFSCPRAPPRLLITYLDIVWDLSDFLFMPVWPDYGLQKVQPFIEKTQLCLN